LLSREACQLINGALRLEAQERVRRTRFETRWRIEAAALIALDG
jgi:hypothetical protein